MKQKDGNFDLYSSDILGQWEERLTTNLGYDGQAYWHKQRKQLIYSSENSRGTFSMLAMDLKDKTVDTLPIPELTDYKLHPNGRQIFYTVVTEELSNIWRCDLKGRNRMALTDSPHHNRYFSLSPKGDKMAFISDRSGLDELYLMDLNTSELQRLTNNEMVEKYITWSPDGKRIAFTMAKPSEDPLWDIYLINADGSGLEQLTNTPYAEQELSWSLSGDKIAFHGSSENDGDQIYTIDLADGKFTKITSGDFYHGEPNWIPLSKE